MGAKLCEYVMAHWGALADWLAALSEWQLVAVGLGCVLLVYAVYTAAWNLWLGIEDAWSGRGDPSPTGSWRQWDEEEPYQEWMAEVWR